MNTTGIVGKKLGMMIYRMSSYGGNLVSFNMAMTDLGVAHYADHLDRLERKAPLISHIAAENNKQMETNIY
jgi:hypothetical protein